jgi:hypothetical protein
METAKPQEPLSQRDVAAELKAAVAARRELGDEMEDPVIEAFHARLERQIDARVDERVAQLRPARSKSVEKAHHEVLFGSLAIAIPLVAIAGGIARGTGIIAVMAVVLILNILYLITR